MSIKEGARTHGLRPECLLAIQEARAIYEELGYEFVLTSLMEGRHSTGSLHYTGQAFDVRTRHLPEDDQEVVAGRLSAALTEDYDVVLEESHLHVEYQPKAPYE